MISGILTIAHLTLHEARRRRIVLAAAICGLGFLAVFGTGMYFITRDLADNPIERGATVTILAILGIYGVNFLATAAAILLSVDTLSGEIGSGVIQTLASKPVRRADVVFGKWLGYWTLTISYLLAMTAGLVLILRVVTGYMPPGLEYALPLMALEVTVLLTFTIAGGTRFSTVTNGIVAFGFYGLAFAGGIVEQAGTILGVLVARDIGTAVSLISPADALWRMAAYYLVPDFVKNLQEGPPIMWSVSAPTAAMVVWSIGFVPVVMALAVRTFNHRTL